MTTAVARCGRPWSSYLDPIMPSTFAAWRKRTWHNRAHPVIASRQRDPEKAGPRACRPLFALCSRQKGADPRACRPLVACCSRQKKSRSSGMPPSLRVLQPPKKRASDGLCSLVCSLVGHSLAPQLVIRPTAARGGSGVMRRSNIISRTRTPPGPDYDF